MNPFASFRESRATLKQLNRIASALERLARVGEEMLMTRSERSVGLRSWYNGGDPEAGDVLQQTDEEFAEMETLEKKRGPGLAMDAELVATPEDEPEFPSE